MFLFETLFNAAYTRNACFSATIVKKLKKKNHNSSLVELFLISLFSFWFPEACYVCGEYIFKAISNVVYIKWIFEMSGLNIMKENFAVLFSKNCWNIVIPHGTVLSIQNYFLLFLIKCSWINILWVDFIKVNGLKWLHNSFIQDINCGIYLFTISFLSSFKYLVFLHIIIW